MGIRVDVSFVKDKENQSLLLDKPQKCLVLPTRKVLLLKGEIKLYEEGVMSSGVGRSAAGPLYSKRTVGERQPYMALPLGDALVTPVPSFLDQVHISELL